MKIVQEPFEGEELLEHWDEYEEEQRLTILCALTEHTQVAVSKLLKEWIEKAGGAA